MLASISHNEAAEGLSVPDPLAFGLEQNRVTTMLFDGWYELLRLLIVGAATYIALIAMLRITGKRTLAKMNAFDLVVSISLGSVLATVLLSRDVSLSEGVAALALLCLLQYLVAFVSVRSEAFQSVIKAQPSLLFHQGRFLAPAMRRQRVTEEEVFAAIRLQGIAQMSDVSAVVLETDGSLSVLTGSTGGSPDTLRYVRREGE
jgi:uncharacterized membrane protein YcaP (DUF421 family)